MAGRALEINSLSQSVQALERGLTYELSRPGSRIGRYGDATDRFGKDKLRTATERGERHFQLSTTNLSWDSIEDEDSGTDTAPARC